MSSETGVTHKRPVLRWEARYVELKRSLTEIGPILPGSVVKRFMPCGKESCRCTAGHHHRHGPYYQWSVALKGKPVAMRLTPLQAKLYQEWIQNNRKIRKTLDEMRRISIRLAEHQTKAMARR